MSTETMGLPDFFSNPYPVYAAMRSEGPVLWSDRHDGWMVTRYDDVAAGFRDPRLSSRRPPPALKNVPPPILERAGSLGAWVDRILMFRDTPYHTRIRGIMAQCYKRYRIDALRELIDRVVAQMLEEIAPRERMEVLRDFAEPLPHYVMSAMLGVPFRDMPRMRFLSYQLTSFITPDATRRGSPVDAHLYWDEMSDTFRAIIARRRASPEEDLVSRMVAARDSGQFESEEELVANCCALLMGGIETVTMLIGSGMLALLRDRESLDELQADRSLVRNAVEELLRIDGPVQMMTRIALEDMEIQGVQVRAGDRVFLLIGSANHDPDHFDQPERLRFDRPHYDHLTFGSGPHFCFGASLARLEANAAFAALVGKLRDIELPPQEIRWKQHNMAFRHIEELHLVFDARAPAKAEPVQIAVVH